MNDHRSRASPRLQFTEEERLDESMAKPIAKAEKAADKADAAQKKLKKQRKLTLERVTPEKTSDKDSPNEHPSAQNEHSKEDLPDNKQPTWQSPGVQNTRQRKIVQNGSQSQSRSEKTSHGKTEKASGKKASQDSAKTVHLKFEEAQPKKPSQLMHTVQKTIRSADDQFHRRVAQSNEDDNVAVNAALRADDTAQSALQLGDHAYSAHKMRPYKQAEKAEKRLDEANLKALEARYQREHPQISSNPYSRWQQRRAIRREYAAAKHNQGKTVVKETAATTEKASARVKDAAVKTEEAFRKHPTLLVVAGLVGFLLVFMNFIQSCSPLTQSVLESIVIGTYPAEEEDVRAAERAYLAKEADLQDEMNDYEAYHPGYDEYIVEADEIWHDPYVLIAIISACFDGQEWNIDTAYPIIEKYFDLQYVVTETLTTETRYHSEEVTEVVLVTDPVTGVSVPETSTYQTDVPYTYTICNVTLENKNLSHLPVVSMSHHTMGMYALYMATHGNMEGIFTGPYATPLRDPMLYDIPQETLDADPNFARLMEEATKYIGYPYVWGGSSPETSFDCSGFVSYVFTNSGVYNTGRLGAKGLRSLCRSVALDDVRPGDIVFFDGTLGEKVDGVTHCGIYVGNNMMIHCGSPIGFANLNDSYWRQHFHSYGRVPY